MLSPEMFQHIVNNHPVGFEGTKPVFHIALFKHRESAEDETGWLHLDLHDPREAEAGKALFSLGWEKANHSPGERQSAIFPTLLTVDVIGAWPAVDGKIPAHFEGRYTDAPEKKGT